MQQHNRSILISPSFTIPSIFKVLYSIKEINNTSHPLPSFYNIINQKKAPEKKDLFKIYDLKIIISDYTINRKIFYTMLLVIQCICITVIKIELIRNLLIILLMLSKQDKLKYGEQLRRQMKQKQEKKTMESMQKRGIKRSPTDIRIPIEPEPYVDNKQILQKRFQTQNVDYYGRNGGGAPNRQIVQQNPPPQYGGYQPTQMGRVKTNQQYNPYPNQQMQNQNFNFIQQQRAPPPQFERGNIDPQYYPKQNYQVNQPYGQAQQGYNQPFAPPTYNQNSQQNIINRVPTDRSFVDQYQQQQQPQQQIPQGYPAYQDQRYNRAPQMDMYQEPIQQINQKHEAVRQKTMENEQLMQIHKKGGRNLLQLENMTIDQQQIKQKQKEQMRRQLQLQMKQAQLRKKQQEDRIKREEIQQQRKNEEYLALQKKRFEEQERKKNDKQRQIQEQNARNLQQRRRLQQQAKQKALRQKMKKSNPNINSGQSSPKMKQKEVFSRQIQMQQLPGQETTSEVSDSTVMEKAINTGVSKQFFQNERKKDEQRYVRQRNLQAVTEQIQRLKQHIDKQNQFFKKEIQKVKLQSQMAENQKQKAQSEIQNLKAQLQRKMEDDNKRLFKALERQSSLANESNQYGLPKRNNQRQRRPPPQQQYNESIKSLKPTKDQYLVKKQYVAPQSPKKASFNQNLSESNVSDGGMLISLHGESKKIPVNLPEDKLSMSRLSDFARETQFFKSDGKSPYLPQKKPSFRVQESIVQQDEDRAESRAVPRKQNKALNNQRDELDKFVETRQKSRGGGGGNWGQLSSVNSDITKQIQQLLKKKDNPYRPPSSTKYDNPYNNNPYMPQDYSNNNERPSSHLSNAGRRALSRNGLEYQGASLGTLNSNVGGTNTLGTLDLDMINNKNDKRLNNFRNLGVQTINTNGQEQFSKLDMILNNYKQSRVL